MTLRWMKTLEQQNQLALEIIYKVLHKNFKILMQIPELPENLTNMEANLYEGTGEPWAGQVALNEIWALTLNELESELDENLGAEVPIGSKIKHAEQLYRTGTGHPWALQYNWVLSYKLYWIFLWTTNLNDGVGDPCAGQLKLCGSLSLTVKSPKVFELDENFGAAEPMGSNKCNLYLYILTFKMLGGIWMSWSIYQNFENMKLLTYMLG